MNESSNNQADDRSGIGETIATALRQPSILRVMLGLAATVVVLVGMRLAAPMLNPILFALSLGLSNVDIRDAVKPGALAGAIGSVLSGVADFLSNIFLILIIVLFFLAEGPALMNRLHASAGRDRPQVVRLTVFGRNVVRQLGLRAIVNLVTGAGVVVLMFVLGVDFPLMWGILTFFLSFIPWIGLPLAVAPAVVLALAEHGIERALLVIAGVIVINVLAENALSPMLMGRGLSLSPTVLFIGFIFWAWLLGGPGAFLAAPLTIFLVLMLETFPETRWLARVMGISPPDSDSSAPEEEVVESTDLTPKSES